VSFSLSKSITCPHDSHRTTAMKRMLPRCGSPCGFHASPPIPTIVGQGRSPRELSLSQTGQFRRPTRVITAAISAFASFPHHTYS